MMSGPLKALLGVVAVAGWQNRDKITELLRSIQNPQPAEGRKGEQPDAGAAAGGLGSIFGGPGGFSDLLGGLSTGGILSGGLGDLLKTFQQNGHGDKAETWVRSGANAPIDSSQLSEALGPDVLNELAAKTGLSRQEIVERLTRNLPEAVDGLTPDGKLPTADHTSTTAPNGAIST